MSILDSVAAVEHSGAKPPAPVNERVRDYAPGSSERASLSTTLERMAADRVDMPLFIDGKEVRTGRLQTAVMPHDHAHVLGDAHLAGEQETSNAIAAAKRVAADWGNRHWSERAAVFLKAAELLAGPWRDTLNAATMLGQSKTVREAEIDAAAELIDMWRFNVHFMMRVYEEQPLSTGGAWNRLDYRPLEGFVLAVTPFNFTAIGGNLPTAPAMMGNTVVWKPAGTAMYSAHFVMQLLRQAGLPDGVINLVSGDGAQISKQALNDPALAAVHFTGSTGVFNGIMKTVAERVSSYRNYPRLVGETGGKNFVLVHPSADLAAAATGIIRGGFEYQGQKCSAASRVFIPQSLWPAVRERLCDDIATIQVGDVRDFKNFMGAVIDEKAWRKHTAAIGEARSNTACKVLTGGGTNMKHGYFIEPTIIQTHDLNSRLLRDELFGPIVTVYVYEDAKFDDIIKTIDSTGIYGLTGSVFARDRAAITRASLGLRHAAGNFYINDKPAGAVIGQQPFGGGRASGTNDKAGSLWNMIRWVSPRNIKETFVPPVDYRYPFLG